MSIPCDILTLMMFSVNLVFIVTNLYGWLLKRFFVPAPFKDRHDDLFPVHRSVANFYLLQLCEVPYLLMVGRPDALFYVNGASLLLFSSFSLVLVRGYFFLQVPTPRQLLLFLLPVWGCWVALLLPLFGIVEFSDEYQLIMTIIVVVLFGGYLVLLNRFRRQLIRRIRELGEDEYSNEEDFPVQFARSIKWLPLVLCLMLFINFLLNDAVVKMVRDILFTVIDVWFVIYTLNPHRRLRDLSLELNQKEVDREVVSGTKYRLSEEQSQEMESRLMALIRDEKLYLEDHLTMNDLIQRLHTNKTYLSEAINRSPYKSFYQLINTLRVDHACRLMEADPTLKLEQVAFASGFTSGSAFSQVFKRIKGVSPSEYFHRNN